MLINDVVRAVSGAVVLLALVSCGGGGDIAGDSTEFDITPKENKLEFFS
jgi:hypothetical protein